MKETAGTASWEMGRYLEGTARSRGGRDTFIRGGASMEATRSGRGRGGVADDGVVDILRSWRGGPGRIGVLAGLGSGTGADVAAGR